MAFKNGHYVESDLSLEELEKINKLAKEEESKLKSWDDVPLINEDQNEDYSYYSYYDGHYKDSGLSAEERERLDKKAKEKPAPQSWE